MPTPAKKPAWDRLYQTASAQNGHFTTQQAAEAGYSTQLLLKHIRAGRIARVRHGVYRLVHFPAAEHEELAVVWLWSERKGVFSHQTALGLHGLSDVLSARIHLTLPIQWRRRRFRVPKDVVLHYASVPSRDRAWAGPVPITSPRRTLVDCARDQVSPDLLRQAAQQALRRGLVTNADLPDVEQALQPFGGLAA
jgi:predicted transcriptional regulator of viral defense system